MVKYGEETVKEKILDAWRRFLIQFLPILFACASFDATPPIHAREERRKSKIDCMILRLIESSQIPPVLSLFYVTHNDGWRCDKINNTNDWLQQVYYNKHITWSNKRDKGKCLFFEIVYSEKNSRKLHSFSRKRQKETYFLPRKFNVPLKTIFRYYTSESSQNLIY